MDEVVQHATTQGERIGALEEGMTVLQRQFTELHEVTRKLLDCVEMLYIYVERKLDAQVVAMKEAGKTAYEFYRRNGGDVVHSWEDLSVSSQDAWMLVAASAINAYKGSRSTDE
jgi:hypothetical protein